MCLLIWYVCTITWNSFFCTHKNATMQLWKKCVHDDALKICQGDDILVKFKNQFFIIKLTHVICPWLFLLKVFFIILKNAHEKMSTCWSLNHSRHSQTDNNFTILCLLNILPIVYALNKLSRLPDVQQSTALFFAINKFIEMYQLKVDYLCAHASVIRGKLI